MPIGVRVRGSFDREASYRQGSRQDVGVARVLVTGSTTGLGLAAGTELAEAGHDVVLHARNRRRAEDIPLKSAVVIGDLAESHEVTELAEQINRMGPFDAVIHNAGVGFTRRRDPNSRDQPSVTAVNLYAPYLLTALIQRPQRLIYLSSGMHAGGYADLNDLNWTSRRWSGTQAYSDSKLLVTTLAFAVARRWPDVRSNVVDPGWVPTRMGGRSASDDLVLGRRTQVWLAVSADPAADTSGRYWYHQQTRRPAAATTDAAFQDQLVDRLEQITGIRL